MTVPEFGAYPVPSRKVYDITDSYLRQYIPGTNTPYQRGAHYGIDIGGAGGEPIHPAIYGSVLHTGDVWGPAYGNQVLLQHNVNGVVFYTFYAHLSDIRVGVGQHVYAASVIGHLGMTGQATGPHLHFELHTQPSWTQGLLNPFGRLENARLL